MKKNSGLLQFGIIGTSITALCCFTPVLVILLGGVGLSALSGYLDYVLFPALLFFTVLTGYAYYRKHKYTTVRSISGKPGDS